MKVKNKFKPDYTIDSSNIDLIGTNGYSEKVINYAKQLKATHQGYADSYYLEQARVHFETINAAFKNAHNKKLSSKLDIQDSKWSRFTYDEIIEMHENGYTVPKEVLDWAYTMHESDITTYEIIPDEADAFDNVLRSNTNSDSGPEKLQENTRKYIVMAQKTNNELIKDYDNFKIISDRANDIKNEKENSYQKEIQQLNSKIQKWKSLNDKNKQNNLSEEEKTEFEELSENLKQSSYDIKEMQNEYKELNEFLNSYEKLSQKTQAALDISKETFELTKNLSEIDTSLNRQRVYNRKAIQSDNTPSSAIPDIAIQAANDLQNTANEINISINDSKTQLTANFAQNYNSALDENINNFQTENLNGIQDENNKNEQKETNVELNNETPQINDENKNLINSTKQKENDDKNNPLKSENSKNTNANIFAQLQRIRTDYEQNSILQILENVQTQQQSQEADITKASNQSQTIAENPAIQAKSALNELSIINNEIQDNSNIINSSKNDLTKIQTEEENNTTIENNTNKVAAPSEETRISQKIENARITNNKKEEHLEDTSDQIHTESKKQENANILEENPEITEDEIQIQVKTDEKQNTEKTTQETNEDIINEKETPVYVDSHDKNATDIPENITLDNIAYAASAAVNANITQSVSTSDKEEKRLTRFNNDSIIESKKKRNRVSAVSGARGSTV